MIQQNAQPHRRTLALLKDVRGQNPNLVGVSPARMTQDGWLRAAGEVEGLLWLNPIPAALVLVTHVDAGSLARQVGRQSGRPSVVVACKPKGLVQVDCWAPGTGGQSSSDARGATIRIRTDEERYPILVDMIATGNGLAVVEWVLNEGRNAESMNLLRAEMLATTAAWTAGGSRDATEDERRYLTVLLFARLLCVSYLSTQCSATRAALDAVLAMEDVWSGWNALVHGALNEPAESRSGIAASWAVPYLNGGLFSVSSVERECAFGLAAARVRELASLFVNLCVLTESDGPALSLDPVVISQLYESTLDASTRASTGSFFTPVALSRRMAKQAVDHLLSGVAEPVELRERLLGATVLDPACGSGTLLVAVFDEIVDRLERCDGPLDSGCESELRRRVVGNLCGVDTSPLAATLCELRLWMSVLAADVRCGVSRPLPNLSHRIRVGDALSSIWDYSADNPAHAVSRQTVERYRSLNEMLLFSTGPSKLQLLRELNEVEYQISEAVEFASRSMEMTDRTPATLPLFDPRPDALVGVQDGPSAVRDVARSAFRRAGGADLEVAFADVLEEGGFSIVIGNPPWVRLSSVPALSRRRICRRFNWMDTSSHRAFGVQPDLSIAFVQRATQLVRQDGIISMLVPAKVLSATSAVRFRVGMAHSCSLLDIQDLQGDAAARFAADVYPLLLCARSAAIEHDGVVRVVRQGSVFHVKQSSLGGVSDAERKWLLMPEDELALVGHLLALGEGEMGWRGLKGMYGMKTGCNAAFESKGGEEHEVEVIGGRDVGTMGVRAGRKMVLPYCWKGVRALRGEEVGIETKERFEGWRDRLEARADWVRGDAIWSVFRLPMEGAGWRVVWRDIAKFVEAAPVRPVDDGGPVGLNTLYVVPVRNEDEAVALSAWLNLTPARLVAAALAEPALGGYRRFRAASVCQMPVGDIVWRPEHEFHGEFVRAAYRWRDGDVEARVRLEEMALLEVGLTDAVSTVVKASRRLGLSEDAGHFSNFVVQG
jgi:hypothetical protein